MNRSSAMASRTTGTIMTMISTDIDHHCGPRVAFWAAIRMGRVWELALERKSASSYSFQVMIRTRMMVAARPGAASGSTIDQKMR